MAYENLSIFEQDFWQINNVLNRLLTSTKASSILLIDKAGQMITSVGNTDSIDLLSFASLSAADYAATSQLALLLGEDEFKEIFHQGKRENIYITVILSKIILVTIFNKNTNLGLMRVKLKSSVKELEQIFVNIFSKLNTPSPQHKNAFDEEFKKAAESEIDDLFD